MSESDPQLLNELKRIADAQEKTANMLESLMFQQVADPDEITYNNARGYWKAEPPWDE